MIPAGLSFLFLGGLFALTALGLAWPLVARAPLEPVEKIVATLALSILGVFVFAWGAFVFGLEVDIHWLLPAIALGGLLHRQREFAATWRDPAMRTLGLGQALVSAWCIGWLALVVSYSGGGWAGDWFEHWERARFFLERGPLDTVFIGHAGVTARPPLANVVTAFFLSLTRANFAHYQFCSTLLGSLAFAPAALLARRLGGNAAIAATALLFCLNPLFVQNATFAWTKLPSAFFVLAAAAFFLRTLQPNTPLRPTVLFAACLGAAILAHYSAVPYAIVLGAAWLGTGWSRIKEPTWWRATFTAAAVAGAVLALWFAWAFNAYGPGGTLTANTTFQAAEITPVRQAIRIARNSFDTLVPHFLRPLDTRLTTQVSLWGTWRDWFFQNYQVNLVFAFGSVAWLVLIGVLRRAWRDAALPVRLGWLAAVAATVFLGIAVHGARDTWGLTHICLQPVVLLGLATLAGHAPALPRPWRLVLIGGATIDFCCGLALHFGVQNLAFDRWFAPQRDLDAIFARYNQVALMNIAAKVQHELVFFADVVALPLPVIAAGLAALLVGGLWLVRDRLRHDT